MSKLNIFKKDWVDIIFEGRNKSYGAYQLRSENPKVTTRSLFAGIALFGLAIASPMLIDMAKGTFGDNKVDKFDETLEVQKIELPKDLPPPPPPPVEDTPPPPPPVEDVKSINDTKKFTEPEIAKKEDVKQEIAKQEDFKKDVEVGGKDQKGDPTAGEVKIKDKTGEGDAREKKEGPSGNGPDNTVFIAVQVPAEFPGGMAKFNQQFVSRFRAPDMDAGTKAIRVIVMFIVERDGSLTDIKVVRDPGFGAGKEAVRVLSGMPKWKAAEQNGQKVRSQFTLPITIQVQ